ncbi:MAG: YihY/virulence factor BrkB family protein [Victivallaceae bacterium]|nr:YihY/virulence factor BrkB family protein [Victivallaceae bacterium]
MKQKMSWFKRFFSIGLWEINLRGLSAFRASCIKLLRILVLSVHGFFADKCQLQASALTFYTIFSIVPLAAMVFGIAKGFGLQKKLQADLNANFSEYQVLLDKLYVLADKALARAQGGTIAVIGLVVLFFTVIKVIGNVEHSFNDIWGIKTARTLFRKCGDYTILLIICPALLLFSSSATVYITTQVSRFARAGYVWDSLVGPIAFVFIKFIPFFLSWFLFTFLYKTMPNTRVKTGSALFGGVIAGTLFQFLQQYYIIIQLAVSQQSAIYGSFTAVPLFLLWLQISWFIVLLGAELAFAHQNIDTYECEPFASNTSNALRRRLLIKSASIIVKAFVSGRNPVNDTDISRACGIPIKESRDILFRLARAGIISKVLNAQDEEIGYKPAVPVDKISIQYIWESVDAVGRTSFPLPEDEEFSLLEKELQALAQDCGNSSHNKLVKDL